MLEKLAIDVKDLAQIAHIIDQGIFVCDQQGKIDYVNPFACSFFGYNHADLIYRNIDIIIPDFDINLLFKQEQVVVDQIPAKNKFGQTIFFTAKITPSPNIERHVIVISDITRKVEGHNKLLQKVEVCEKLTKSRFIREGKLDDAINEIISESSKTLEVSRVNAWLIDKNFSLIECIGNYSSTMNISNEKAVLMRKDMPSYFKLLETQEIITTNNTLSDPRTAELVDIYLKKHGITSMMDVPIRIEGEMIGVVCFEHTGIPRTWNLTERKFGLFIAQLISLALETNERQKGQQKLEKAYREKELLLAEIHHRVKNNLAMVSSLVNLQESKSKDDYHRELFKESRNRILSMASIHQMLYQNKNFEKVDFGRYIEEILSLLKQSYNDIGKIVKINTHVDNVDLEIGTAIPLGLIVNEIISNSFKHAFDGRGSHEINIYLRAKNNAYFLEISDNGKGIEKYDEKMQQGTLGLSLIHELAEQINGKVECFSKNGCLYHIYFE